DARGEGPCPRRRRGGGQQGSGSTGQAGGGKRRRGERAAAEGASSLTSQEEEALRAAAVAAAVGQSKSESVAHVRQNPGNGGVERRARAPRDGDRRGCEPWRGQVERRQGARARVPGDISG